MRLVSDDNAFTATVRRAFSEIDSNWESYDGTVLCGSHDPKDYPNRITMTKWLREGTIPTLGICKGLHYMAVEWARNVKKIREANDEEITDDGLHIINSIGHVRVGLADGGEGRKESHWHRYAVNTKFEHLFDGWEITKSSDGIIEKMSLPTHRFYVGVQYHPEYASAKGNPHPMLVKFLEVCRK